MAGNLEGVFAVDYRPLVATDDQKPEEAELSFDIEELGTYRYVGVGAVGSFVLTKCEECTPWFHTVHMRSKAR